MRGLVTLFALGLIGFGLIAAAGCSAPAAEANLAPPGTVATAIVTPTLTITSPVTPVATVTVTAAISPCIVTPIAVRTMPARNPGYAQPDPATDNRLHITGQATEINPAQYRLKVTGLVDRDLELTYDELRCTPRASVHCILVCPGFFEDEATWTGVPLTHILDLAGVKPEASGIKLIGADGYRIEVSLSAARFADNLLAYQWEDEPLPVLHGFPLRAVFPELQGNHWVKWLIEIQVY